MKQFSLVLAAATLGLLPLNAVADYITTSSSRYFHWEHPTNHHHRSPVTVNIHKHYHKKPEYRRPGIYNHHRWKPRRHYNRYYHYSGHSNYTSDCYRRPSTHHHHYYRPYWRKGY